MGRRSDHSREELKELLLDTAHKMVEKHGYEQVTARALAKKIGYAPGTIYNIFPSMDALYLALNAKTLDKLSGVLKSAACNDSGTPSVQNMITMATAYHDFAYQNKAHWLMLFTHSLPEGELVPDWYQEKIDCLFEPLEELLSAYYTSAQARERRMAARILWAGVHGLCFLEETGKIQRVDDKSDATNMAAYMIETFIKGLKPSKH